MPIHLSCLSNGAAHLTLCVFVWQEVVIVAMMTVAVEATWATAALIDGGLRALAPTTKEVTGTAGTPVIPDLM